MTTPSEAAKKWAEKRITLEQQHADVESRVLAARIANAFDAGVAHARAEWEGEKEKVRRYVRAAGEMALIHDDDQAEYAARMDALPSWARE